MEETNSRCCLAVARNPRTWATVQTVPRLMGLGSGPLGPLHRVAADDLVHDHGESQVKIP